MIRSEQAPPIWFGDHIACGDRIVKANPIIGIAVADVFGPRGIGSIAAIIVVFSVSQTACSANLALAGTLDEINRRLYRFYFRMHNGLRDGNGEDVSSRRRQLAADTAATQ